MNAGDFIPGKMFDKYGPGDAYATAPRKKSAFPGMDFYFHLLAGPFHWLCRRAAKGECDDFAWTFSSAWVGEVVENVGGVIEINGMSNVRADGKPCVYIANHMSTLETFLLPAMIRPIKPVTFVVKKSLATLPIFGPVMRSRNPVIVGRKNPRKDLASVLDGGIARLSQGISIIVFPQSTRSLYFDPRQFSSIGVKLARHANVPVVPVALKTDFWGMGRKIKEAGKIGPQYPARFLFGEPMRIAANGKAEQAEICRFIGENLAAWQKTDGVNE